MSTDDIVEQPIPEDSRCPECRAKPTEDSIVKHRLSSHGYLHDDKKLKCRKEGCGTEWRHGIPVGDFDQPEMAADLWCDSCDSEWMLTHRVAPKSAEVVLHLKCPNCFHFDKVRRSKDTKNGDVVLVGYPQITGETDGCKPYGYSHGD